MKILLVGAGATFSTKDVEAGYYNALLEQKHEVELYLLDKRLEIADEWLKFLWKKRWNKDPERKPGWADTIYRGSVEALEAALRYKVDWVLIISAMYFHMDVLIYLRECGFRVATLLTESPYQDTQQAKVARVSNVVFTNERTSVPTLRTLNPNTFYIRHATPKYIASAEPPVLAGHDVLFVGSGFQERIEALDSVDWGRWGINLGLYGTWALLPARHRLRKYIRGGPITNKMAHELYKASRINLNLYRTSVEYAVNSPRITHAESLNPRAYELAEVGGFCITDGRREGAETFGASQPEIWGSLERTILYYLQRKEEREKKIRQAKQLVRGHDYTARAIELVNILEQVQCQQSSITASVA